MIGRPVSSRSRDLLVIAHVLMPVALVWSLAEIVARRTRSPLQGRGLVVLLSGCLAVYCLDRVRDDDDAVMEIISPLGRRFVGVLAVASGIICGAFSILDWRRLGAVAVPLAVASLAYPWLKRLPFFKNMVVTGVWVGGICGLPFSPGGTIRAWATGVAVPIALLLVAACAACDVKDRERDRRRGIMTLPSMMSVKHAAVSTALIALSGTIWAISRHWWALSSDGLILIGLCCFPAWLARPLAGPLLVDGLMTIPGAILALWH